MATLFFFTGFEAIRGLNLCELVYFLYFQHNVLSVITFNMYNADLKLFMVSIGACFSIDIR